MNTQTKELVGIAVAGYCKKCFSYHSAQARKLKIEQKDIEEVIGFSKAIRSSGNQGMDEFVQKTISQK